MKLCLLVLDVVPLTGKTIKKSP